MPVLENPDTQPGRPAWLPKISLSVDVEALPSRTSEVDKVGRLMWGRFGDTLMGVPRLIDILEELGVPATFFLEYLATLRYGKAPVFEVGSYIVRRGQDLQIHGHPEVIPTGVENAGHHSFSGMQLDVQVALLRLMRNLYLENTGFQSKIFRGGGLRFDSATPLAASRAGFSALSNYYGDAYLQPYDYFHLPSSFCWTTGVHELTVSACLDEIIQAGEDWKERLDKLLVGPAPVRHFFIHSWSLIRRDAKGFHDNFDSAYADRFKLILEYLKAKCGFVHVDEPLDHHRQQEEVAPELMADPPDGRGRTLFGLPHAQFARYRLFSTNKARSRHEFLWEQLDQASFQSAAPAAPTLLPMRLVASHTCFVLHARSAEGSGRVPYVISGNRAHLQLNRQVFPVPGGATEVLSAIFRKHPQINEIVFSLLYGDDLLNSPFVESQQAGSTYVLALPATFQFYRDAIIGKNLRRLIERKERALYRAYPDTKVHFCGAGFDEELTPALFARLVDIVRSRRSDKARSRGIEWIDPYTPEWTERNFPAYRDFGLCSFIEVDGRIAAVMLNLVRDEALSYMASGHLESIIPSGHTAKILFFRTIERFMAAGGRVMQLYSGDFGFKERFGARAVDLHSGSAHRYAGLSSQAPNTAADRVARLFAKGCNMRDIHVSLGVSARMWVGIGPHAPYAFDFNTANLPAPPAGWRIWQPPHVDAVYMTLDRLYDSFQPRALFDWNCAAGRTLLAVAEYGINTLGGLVFSNAMSALCQSNFAAAKLPPPDVLVAESPQDIATLNLGGYDLFLAYHPAYEPALRLIAAAMKKASATSGKPVYFIYINCLLRDMFLDEGFEERAHFDGSVAGWRFSERAAILSYDASDQ